MAFDESLAARIRDALAQQKGVEEKKLFGGVGFLLNGNLLVGACKDSLIVRLGPDEGEEALREPHVREIDITGRAMKGWVLVEPEGVEAGDQPEGIGPLEEAAADRLRDFLGEQQEFFLVGVQGGGEPADQVFAGVVAGVEFAVLDLADVGERDAHPLAQRPLAEAPCGA
jgi:hypothetical protein